MGDSRDEEIDYPFPGPFKPMDNQIERFNFLLANQYGWDFSEMGTGKTAVATWAADYLMQVAGGSVLILAPKTTLTTVWERHCDAIMGDTNSSYRLLSGSNASRAKQISET